MSLYSELKAYRLSAARAKAQPAFCIFANKVLDAIVAAVPRNASQLSRISGLGPKKIAEHGAAIISICQRSGAAPCSRSSCRRRRGARRPALHSGRSGRMCHWFVRWSLPLRW